MIGNEPRYFFADGNICEGYPRGGSDLYGCSPRERRGGHAHKNREFKRGIKRRPIAR